MSRINQEALDQLFLVSQTAHGFDTTKPVSDETLKEIYDLAKMPPTCFNASPLRITFVKSEENKAKVLDSLFDGNKKQTSEASVVALLAYDEKYIDHFPFLCPAVDAKTIFLNNPSWIAPQAQLNSSLAAGYFLLAARSLGVEVGPMTGLDMSKIEADFFADTTYKPFLVVNLGYAATPNAYYPRAPRFDFDQVNKIV